MKIRTAGAEEMLRLWGYRTVRDAPPTARFFYENIAAGNAVFWTVDRDGDLIGELYAFQKLESDLDFADGSTTAYLCAFRIRQDCRGQGLGSRLMEAAAADLRSRGFRYATIGVGCEEERNQRLYFRLGFTEKRKACLFDPCAMDETMRPRADRFLLLARDLDSPPPRT